MWALIALAPAQAQDVVGVWQFTPGAHLFIDRRGVGLGLNSDVLGGLVFGDREFNDHPGMLAGPMVEVNFVYPVGVSVTLGVRAGAGVMRPTGVGGIFPLGTLNGHVGHTFGAVEGLRWGGRFRTVLGHIGVHHQATLGIGGTLGVEAPVFPPPVVID